MENYINLDNLPISSGDELAVILGFDESGNIIKSENSNKQIIVDSELSTTSENPVQNKIITAAINQLNDTIGDINNILTEINGQ